MALPPRTDGFVWIYILHSGGVVKVGQTIEPIKRFPVLQRPRAYLLEFFCAYAAPVHRAEQVEYFSHVSLRDYKIDGEWFLASPMQAEQAIQLAITHQVGRRCDRYPVHL